MGKVLDPSDPARADYRLIKDLLEGKKVQNLPHEYDHAIAVFGKLGGSWEKVFKGSVRHTKLLKNILKAGIKNGWISKAPKWG